MSAVDNLISSYLANECNEEMFVFLFQNQHIIRYIQTLNNNDVNCICSKEKKKHCDCDLDELKSFVHWLLLHPMLHVLCLLVSGVRV